MIDNIIINNTSLPEYPGEWAGVLVQVNTKDIPSAKFFIYPGGNQHEQQHHRKDFYTYKGGKFDWLGFDDGARALPDFFQRILNSQNFMSESEVKLDSGNECATDKSSVTHGQAHWQPSVRISRPAADLIQNYFNKEFGVVSLWPLPTTGRVKRLEYNNSFFVINARALNRVLFILMINTTRRSSVVPYRQFSLKFNANNKISFKNIINVTTSDYTNLRTGLDFEANSHSGNISARGNLASGQIRSSTPFFLESTISLPAKRNSTGMEVSIFLTR